MTKMEKVKPFKIIIVLIIFRKQELFCKLLIPSQSLSLVP